MIDGSYIFIGANSMGLRHGFVYAVKLIERELSGYTGGGSLYIAKVVLRKPYRKTVFREYNALEDFAREWKLSEEEKTKHDTAD